MIFSTYLFIFGFLPFCFSIYFLLNKFGLINLSKWFLVFCSLFFYWFGTKSFFPFFLGSVIFNYSVGIFLNRLKFQKSNIRRKVLLIVGIVLNCILLGYFKYTNFIISNINFFLEDDIIYKKILLPIGISFFTFQLIAYLVDSYRGETNEYKFLNYLLFITFFPQLIVGPIVHHKDVNYQYENKDNFKLNYKNISLGIFLFFIGTAKKTLIADNITPLASIAFSNSGDLSLIDSWVASIGYTVSYYFDLSGYADMAIGLGLMFNIHIPINFNSPYKANNFAEYWKRWHITLSKFLGDYIFRSVKKKNGTTRNFYWAIFVTFLVSGIWHGAGWTFFVWGIINGLFVIISHMIMDQKIIIPNRVAHFFTFLGVIGTRVLFVSNTFLIATNVFKSMFDISKLSLDNNFYTTKEQLFFIIIGLLIAFFLPNSNEMKENFKPNKRHLIFTVILAAISFANMGNVGNFLYFQF